MGPGLVVKRSRTERMQDIVIGALLMACFCVAAAIAVLQFPIPLRETPIVYHDTMLPVEREYCVGELFVYRVDIEITRPTIFSLNTGIKNADNEIFHLSTLKQGPFIPRSKPTRIIQPISFVIPDLPPGDYIRVAAVDADHVDSVPVFSEVPFTIGEHCEESS